MITAALNIEKFSPGELSDFMPGLLRSGGGLLLILLLLAAPVYAQAPAAQTSSDSGTEVSGSSETTTVSRLAWNLAKQMKL